MTAPLVRFRTAVEVGAAAPRVARHLRAGGLVAYPTETVYGFGCALLPEALAALARLKSRAETKPFLLLIRSIEEAPDLEWTDAARTLAAAFWPGPLTLGLRGDPRRYPPGVIATDGTVAVRATPHAGVRALLAELRGPITSTSANRRGQPPATSAAEVLAVLRDLESAQEVWVLDGGALPPSPPSTIVDCSGARPRLLRAGAVPVQALREALDELDA